MVVQPQPLSVQSPREFSPLVVFQLPLARLLLFTLQELTRPIAFMFPTARLILIYIYMRILWRLAMNKTAPYLLLTFFVEWGMTPLVMTATRMILTCCLMP